MEYSKTQDTIILNNHTITTEYYEHKEEAFNSYLDEHFSQLESTITSLKPYVKNIHFANKIQNIDTKVNEYVR